MKSKNISIILFILVFAGVTLFACTEIAQAFGWPPAPEWPPTPTYGGLGDGICDPAEIGENLAIQLDSKYCIELLPDPSGSLWTVVYPSCPETDEDCIADHKCTDPEGCKRWMYRGSIPPQHSCWGIKSWKHLTMVLRLCGEDTIEDYIVNTKPRWHTFGGPGNDEPSCDIEVGSEQEFVKWYPGLYCKRSGNWKDFAVYATMDSQTDFCAFMNVKLKYCGGGGCKGDYILGPGCSQTDITLFTIGGFSAELDQCTGDPIKGTVTIDGEEAMEVMTWFCEQEDGTACNPMERTDCLCIPLTNTGPQSGAFFESLTNPRRGCIGARCFR